MPASEDSAGIKEILIAERAKLLQAFKGMTPNAMTRPYNGGWSLKDVLAHSPWRKA